MTLNPAQKEAVETLSGPLLVLAGAGTGKTRVVTYRIARLIKNGIRPSRILAVTFTNKAAKEMQERITGLLGKRPPGQAKEKPLISTFHSLCVRILRRHIQHLGYPQQFAIYDRGDQESIARQVLREIKVSDAALKPGDLLSIISQWKCASLGPDAASGEAWSAKEYLASLAYGRYQKMLKTRGAVDFDDLLLCTEELFRNFPDVRAEEAGRFDHLLVDEYQDTNMSQYRIVKALAKEHRNLCVVGDDDQAIYGWRGAEVTHILNFKKDWPEAKTVRLEANYRSTTEIIEWANRVIAFNTVRHGKKLYCNVRGEPPRILQCKDGEIEAKTVVGMIRNRLDTTSRQPRDFAILFRTNEQPRSFEMELRSAKVPYILIGGQSFFDKKEVRDVLAYLKVLLRPQDEVSLLRILNTPPRGIGQGSIQKLTQSSISSKKSIWESMNDSENILSEIPGKIRDSLDRFRRTIEEYKQRFEKEFNPQLLTDFVNAIEYEKEIERQYQDPEERKTRWNSVGEIVNAATAYVNEHSSPSLQEFLDETSLAGPDFGSDNEKNLRKNAVVLMTLHAAKGLEFKEVYMVGLEEGILPHRRSVDSEDASAIDEERRLCYVGITRAQKRLTLTMALNRLKWGQLRPTIPSRFLYEITGQADNPNYLKSIRGEEPKTAKKQ